jgi:murein DD-endopeptidase MepM/ murein hydrolase activator NlpD
MEAENRSDHLYMRSAALLAVGALLLAGCFSMPGDPDDPQDPDCLAHASFGNPEDSLYLLPYPEGLAYEVFQTYCGPVSHGRDGQMSIDFLMPMGSDVVAARAGIVRYAVDHHEDFSRGINLIYIEHLDNTAAFYAHLQQGSAMVRVGDRVVAGQLIALRGASGTSLEHLHFGVSSRWPVRKQDDMPVNFRNSRGDLDERGGLQKGVVYLAVADSEN